MTPDEFKAWRKSLGFTQTEAAEALGVSRGSVELYELGKRRDDGREVVIPKTIALACAALEAHLLPYSEKPSGSPKVFRIIISAPDDIDHFTVDTLIKSATDEHHALHELLKHTKPVGDKAIDRPIQNLIASRN